MIWKLTCTLRKKHSTLKSAQLGRTSRWKLKSQVKKVYTISSSRSSIHSRTKINHLRNSLNAKITYTDSISRKHSLNRRTSAYHRRKMRKYNSKSGSRVRKRGKRKRENLISKATTENDNFAVCFISIFSIDASLEKFRSKESLGTKPNWAKEAVTLKEKLKIELSE